MLGAHKTALQFMLIQTATARQDQEDNYQNVSDVCDKVFLLLLFFFLKLTEIWQAPFTDSVPCFTILLTCWTGDKPARPLEQTLREAARPVGGQSL